MMDRTFVDKVRISGNDRESLLHRMTTNEIRNLAVGETRVTIFANSIGRVIDLVELLGFENHYLLLTGAGRGETVRAWIDKYTFIEDVTAEEISSDLGIISLFGTESASRVIEILHTDEIKIEPGHFHKVQWQGRDLILHSPAGATVATFNLIADARLLEALWHELLQGFVPIGFEAYEMLRIMHGVPAADHEIVDEYNPHEIGLFPFVNLDKGCYIGQEVIARLDTYEKVQRRLVGARVDAAPEALTGTPLYVDTTEAGKLTSATAAPDGSGVVGLAVVGKKFAGAGTPVELKLADGSAFGVIASLPFEEMGKN